MNDKKTLLEWCYSIQSLAMVHPSDVLLLDQRECNERLGLFKDTIVHIAEIMEDIDAAIRDAIKDLPVKEQFRLHVECAPSDFGAKSINEIMSIVMKELFNAGIRPYSLSNKQMTLLVNAMNVKMNIKSLMEFLSNETIMKFPKVREIRDTKTELVKSEDEEESREF